MISRLMIKINPQSSIFKLYLYPAEFAKIVCEKYKYFHEL